MDDLVEEARAMDSDKINVYLDVWFRDTEAEDLAQTLARLENSLMHLDYQATRPFFDELCKRNKPYKGMFDVCATPSELSAVCDLCDVRPYRGMEEDRR